MPKKISIIVKESVRELRNLQLNQTNPSLLGRIQMLILLKSEQYIYQTDLAEALDYSLGAVHIWINKYKEKGLEGLLAFKRGGKRPAAINGEVYNKVKAQLENPNNQITSYAELQSYISALGVDIKYKALYKFVNEHFKARLKVGRKSNIKKDEAAVAVFKNDTRTYKTH